MDRIFSLPIFSILQAGSLEQWQSQAPAMLGGAWPVLPLLAQMVPAAQSVDWKFFGGLMGCVLFLGTCYWLGLQIRIGHRQLGPQAPAKVEQPITTRREVVYVSTDYFEIEMGKIAQRFLGIELQIREQVTKTDKYLHEFRHEMKDDLNSVKLDAINQVDRLSEQITAQAKHTTESVGKVHGRVDQVAALMGEVRGELRHISAAIHSQKGGAS